MNDAQQIKFADESANRLRDEVARLHRKVSRAKVALNFVAHGACCYSLEVATNAAKEALKELLMKEQLPQTAGDVAAHHIAKTAAASAANFKAAQEAAKAAEIHAENERKIASLLAGPTEPVTTQDEKPWLRKTLDDAKAAFAEQPDWAKPEIGAGLTEMSAFKSAERSVKEDLAATKAAQEVARLKREGFLNPKESEPMREKPSLGVMPEYIWREKRMWNLICALADRTRSSGEIPGEWLEELKRRLGEVIPNNSEKVLRAC